jgi:hypothetical protein
MCTVLLPPGDKPIAVNKYISYHDHDDDSVQIVMEKSAKAKTWKTRYESKRIYPKYEYRFLCDNCKLSHHPE